MQKLSLFFFLFLFFTLGHAQELPVRIGAEQTERYFHLLKGKHIALVVNQTSVVGDVHLVDTLFRSGFVIKKIFAPEHGFRGEAEAGATIHDSEDTKTGIPVVSIYGKNKKPTPEHLNDVDVVIFDIQDVGVRFYTYISTMHYVMEACAENHVDMLVLDRPNPHGATVDGPMLKPGFESFVGMHPIPVVHGLTVGELADMINGERWLEGGTHCNLTVIPCENWNHTMPWAWDIPPSPNLPNMQAVRLYPSLCFFEGTEVSVGRGTDFPFQVVGYPDPKFGAFSFTPESVPAAIKPLQMGKRCYGIDLREAAAESFTLKYLLAFSELFNAPGDLITRKSFFNLLAGNNLLAQQIKQGLSEEEIRASWEADLTAYKELRKKYLRYPDFE